MHSYTPIPTFHPALPASSADTYSRTMIIWDPFRDDYSVRLGLFICIFQFDFGCTSYRYLEKIVIFIQLQSVHGVHWETGPKNIHKQRDMTTRCFTIEFFMKGSHQLIYSVFECFSNWTSKVRIYTPLLSLFIAGSRCPSCSLCHCYAESINFWLESRRLTKRFLSGSVDI